MKRETCCLSFLKNSKPYIGMISLQFGYAGMNIITKISLNGGMSHYVLVVYRHAFATAVIAPFAFFFERKAQPRITFRVFVQIFVLALLGPVIDQNFYYAGLKLTSPTFSCAMSNMLPAFNIYLGYYMQRWLGPTRQSQTATTSSAAAERDWVIGCILLIIATLAWAALFILQKAALKTYSNHQLSLTTLMCFTGTLQAIVVTFVMERKTSVWRIGWDMNLLAAAYAGIVTSSISYYVQGLVMKSKGPVFATAFSPLMMIIVAIMGSFILAEKIYLGGLKLVREQDDRRCNNSCWSLLISMGNYKEEREAKMKRQLEEIPEMGVNDSAQMNGNTQLMIASTNEVNGNIEMPKAEADKCPSVSIDLPISHPPTKPTQEV
ncbi:UNVERIFIED_CONTAM: WAT1-related protein [Sesamum latifolium]|uniref:WAT1-related protein n=1 Tax=Sesamum latifolium TaxID=2727402 RepID=A0AAW2XSR7_9LAMI